MGSKLFTDAEKLDKLEGAISTALTLNHNAIVSHIKNHMLSATNFPADIQSLEWVHKRCPQARCSTIF